MKEYKHYTSDCKNCKTYKACMEENDKTNCTNEYPYIPYKIFKAVNKTEIHYFDNEMNFVDFLRTHFGEYKAILPENYYEKL